MYFVNTSCTSLYRRGGKRLLDLSLAVLALIVISPLLFLVWLCSLILLGRPVLFKQRRAGYQGRPFMLYKFRSMVDIRDERGELLPDACRLTTYGCLLRSTSVDELPGLWNVIKGEMSLIGPRALPVEYTDFYSQEQLARLSVMPGIAGYAALFGRNAQSWEALFQRDVWYSQNLSLSLDLKIILGVIRLVLSRQGIDRGGHDAGSPFAEKLKRNLHAANLPTTVNVPPCQYS
jgi:lipopolysaccharide/colanic/teichoic acid biosynthesis glycosyltransferase